MTEDCNKNKETEGQTIVEVVIVVAIIVVTITAFIAATVSSLKVTRFTSNKSQGTKLAQEGIELTRASRDQSWNTFYGRRNQLWCVDANAVWTVAPGGGCPFTIQSTFSRSIRLDWNTTNPNPNLYRMEVIVTVRWLDGASTHQSEIRTYYTQWR